MLDASEYSCSSIEPFITTPSSSSRRAKKIKNKRRFSDEQIKSLETLFESETRLEPRMKLQLAKELGLQPRQVAIWFQNKRARWKSKQLERDYSVLRANYNTLASKIESLKKEKQALALQLQKLNDKILGSKTNSSEGESGNREAVKCESSEAKACDELIRRSSAQGLGVLSDEGSSVKTEYFGLDEEEKANLMSIMQTTDGSLTTSQDDWESLHSDDLFGQSNTGGQWWDFWV